MSDAYSIGGDPPTPLPITMLRDATPPPEPERARRLIHVLLVEDDPDDAELVEILLGQVDGVPFHFACANSLQEAHTRLDSSDVDAILLDLTLPQCHSIDSFGPFFERERHVPIIVLTSVDDRNVAVAAMQCGAQDYLVKGQLTAEMLGRALRYSIERKMAERRLRAQHAVTSVLAQSNTLTEATPRILQAICESIGWNFGAIWEVNEERGVLECVEVWSRAGDDFREFEAITRSTRFVPGVGLPGRVWKGAAPACIRDVSRDENFPRAAIADRCGLHGALGFPVFSHGRVSGVLEFYTRQLLQPDDDLQSMMGTLGSQIGQFIDRRQAEAARGVAEEKYREIVENAIEGIFQTSPGGRFLTANPAMARILGYESPEQLMHEVHDIAHQLHVDPQRRTELAKLLDDHGFVQRFELQLRRRDGTHIWVSSNIRAVRGPDGHVARFEGSAEDITERKRAAEIERELLANEEEFRIAREIQQKLFPLHSPDLPGFDIAGAAYPAVATSGDYFDYISLPDGSLNLVVGDVAGHGFGPALLMADIRAYLRALTVDHSDLQELLRMLNLLLMNDVTEGRFVTLFLGRLDPHTRTFTYASAGHPPAYVISKGGRVLSLPSTSWPMGIDVKTEFTVAVPIQLQPGDIVLMITDGVTDAGSPEGFGVARLLEIINRTRHLAAAEMVQLIYEVVHDFALPRPLLDDLTMLIIKVSECDGAGKTDPAQS